MTLRRHPSVVFVFVVPPPSVRRFRFKFGTWFLHRDRDLFSCIQFLRMINNLCLRMWYLCAIPIMSHAVRVLFALSFYHHIRICTRYSRNAWNRARVAPSFFLLRKFRSTTFHSMSIAIKIANYFLSAVLYYYLFLRKLLSPTYLSDSDSTWNHDHVAKTYLPT